MEEVNEGINIVNIFLSKISFSRSTEKVTVEQNESLDFDVNVWHEEKEDLLLVYLSVAAKSSIDSNIQFNCYVEYTGHYTIVGDKPYYYDDFINISAPAMIYPFVREEIALITLKSIGRSLMLKPFNFIKFAERVKNKAAAKLNPAEVSEKK